MKKKIALITGITGQDGSYLAELLLSKEEYSEVHGIKRRGSSLNTQRIDHIFSNEKLIIHYGDMTDALSLSQIITKILPDEIYNLAAMSHVAVSFEMPSYVTDVNAMGILRILDICKNNSLLRDTRIYQAGTSEMYGSANTEIFNPRSPYASSKLLAFNSMKIYREAYGMFCVNGILFNHTSPRRGETFVEQKICRAAVAIKKGLQDCLILGNLNSIRNYGSSREYVYGIWKMLQHPIPRDHVVFNKGQDYSVRQICDMVFEKLGMKLKWCIDSLTGIEYALDKDNHKLLIKTSERYHRPLDVECLTGNDTLETSLMSLMWKPSITFEEIIDDMLESCLI